MYALRKLRCAGSGRVSKDSFNNLIPRLDEYSRRMIYLDEWLRRFGIIHSGEEF
jgi:hypothetical protein